MESNTEDEKKRSASNTGGMRRTMIFTRCLALRYKLTGGVFAQCRNHDAVSV